MSFQDLEIWHTSRIGVLLEVQPCLAQCLAVIQRVDMIWPQRPAETIRHWWAVSAHATYKCHRSCVIPMTRWIQLHDDTWLTQLGGSYGAVCKLIIDVFKYIIADCITAAFIASSHPSATEPHCKMRLSASEQQVRLQASQWWKPPAGNLPHGMVNGCKR